MKWIIDGPVTGPGCWIVEDGGWQESGFRKSICYVLIDWPATAETKAKLLATATEICDSHNEALAGGRR